MNKNVVPITEKVVKVIGVKVQGYGDQTLEVRSYMNEPKAGNEFDKHKIMIMVNGRDTDVAYVDVVDLREALTMLGVIS